jgi:hypothetical protein
LICVEPSGVITGFCFASASTADQPLAETFFALVHVQERCWVMRCSALTSWPSEVAKPLLKVHKTSLSIAQEVA